MLLLGASAPVNATDVQGSTALHSACYGGHTECVALLLRAKADVEAKDLEECTPLHLAAFFGHLGAQLAGNISIIISFVLKSDS